MAAKGNWNYVDSTGVWHNVTLNKNKVSIDGAEPFRINKYRVPGSNLIEGVFQVPNAQGEDIKMYVAGNNAVLTHRGIDVMTGEVYEHKDMPKWMWVFYILYILDFFLIVGGAIGGGLFGAGAFCCSAIGVKKDMKTVTKVLICTGIFIAFTALGIVIGLAVNSMISKLF